MPYLPAWAKLNLGLEVGAKRRDGYHEIKSVMQTVSLADRLLLEPQADHVSLEVTGADLPTDARNIAVQAAHLLRDRCRVRCGVHIKLIKRIPSAAGLGGGSADAAAVLSGLNRLWQLNLSQTDLISLAADLGSDVPFALLGGTALATGRGEVVSPLPALPHCCFVLVCPPVTISTTWAYAQLERMSARPDPSPSIDALLFGLEAGDLASIAANLANSFELVMAAHFPLIRDIKQKLLAAGALAASMSGSGPAVYGLFSDRNKAAAALSVFGSEVAVYVLEPVSRGARRLVEE